MGLWAAVVALLDANLAKKLPSPSLVDDFTDKVHYVFSNISVYSCKDTAQTTGA